MRILGLDVGERTIGVAVSDALGWTAQGVTVIRRQNLQAIHALRAGERIRGRQVCCGPAPTD